MDQDRSNLLLAARPKNVQELRQIFGDAWRNDVFVYAAFSHANQQGWTVEQTLIFLVEALVESKRAAMELLGKQELAPIERFAFASNRPMSGLCDCTKTLGGDVMVVNRRCPQHGDIRL